MQSARRGVVGRGAPSLLRSLLRGSRTASRLAQPAAAVAAPPQSVCTRSLVTPAVASSASRGAVASPFIRGFATDAAPAGDKQPKEKKEKTAAAAAGGEKAAAKGEKADAKKKGAAAAAADKTDAKATKPAESEEASGGGSGRAAGDIRHLRGQFSDTPTKVPAEIYVDMKGTTMPFWAPRPYPPPLSDRLTLLPDLYSATTEMSKLGPQDVGRYVQIPADDIPECLRRGVYHEFRRTRNFMLLRQDVYPLFDGVRKIAGDSKAELRSKSILVDGGRGVGKSMTLNFLAAYGMQNGWLVIPVLPDDFGKDKLGFIVPSKLREGTYDQARYTLKWFRAMRDGPQAERMKTVKLKNKYEFTVYDKIADDAAERKDRGAGRAPSTLYDLVLWGSDTRLNSARALYDFLAEARKCTELPVMVLYENFNRLDHRTELLHHETTHPLRGWELAMCYSHAEFIDDPPVNGVTIYTTTSRGTQRRVDNYRETHKISKYSRDEHVKALQHYSMSQILAAPVTEEFIQRSLALTGAVPADVYTDSALM